MDFLYPIFFEVIVAHLCSVCMYNYPNKIMNFRICRLFESALCGSLTTNDWLPVTDRV